MLYSFADNLDYSHKVPVLSRRGLELIVDVGFTHIAYLIIVLSNVLPQLHASLNLQYQLTAMHALLVIGYYGSSV